MNDPTEFDPQSVMIPTEVEGLWLWHNVWLCDWSGNIFFRVECTGCGYVRYIPQRQISIGGCASCVVESGSIHTTIPQLIRGASIGDRAEMLQLRAARRALEGGVEDDAAEKEGVDARDGRGRSESRRNEDRYVI
jgi:hypothetical protein